LQGTARVLASTAVGAQIESVLGVDLGKYFVYGIVAAARHGTLSAAVWGFDIH
jgi:hypothetical protein